MGTLSQVYVCRSSSSMSSLIGNVALIVRKFLEGIFPPGYFKNVYIDTRMMQLEFEKQDVFKKEKPILILRPRFSLDDSNTLFGRLPDWFSTTYFVYREPRGNYVPVFVDEEKRKYIHSVPDRIRVSFEIELVLSSRMQQLNAAHFLKGAMMHRGYFKIPGVYLETEVPKYFIKLLAQSEGVDMADPVQKSDFLSYLQTKSRAAITEKIKMSSGNPAYFYLYRTNLILNTDDVPQLDDGEQRDQVYSNFRVNDTLNVEFWAPANFFFQTSEPPAIVNPEPPPSDDLDADKILLNYTMNRPIPTRDPSSGMDFLKKQGYIADNVAVDETWLGGFLDREWQEVIAYNLKYGVDNDDFFRAVMYMDDTMVAPEKVSVDWKTLTLRLQDPNPDATYLLVLYGDRGKINSTFQHILEISGEVYQK